ncbi:MAG: YdcF family protein, partial [Phycisphaerae bacterium]
QMALELAIPESAIVVGPQATNTESESIQHAKTLRDLGVKKILLATSVFHLPRAAMQFRALGFEVVELPCHYFTAGIDEQFSWRMLLPRGQALDQTETCCKEYLGLVAATLFPAKEAAVEPTS